MGIIKIERKNENPPARFFSRPFAYATVFSLFLAAVFTFTLLDTFVIPKAIRSVHKNDIPALQNDSGQTPSTASLLKQKPDDNTPELWQTVDAEINAVTVPEITDTSYKDENIEISIETVRVYDTDVYIADIQISSINYLKTAFAQDTYGRNINEKTSTIAKEQDAIFAVNGDYYGFRNEGWVLRNGVLYCAGGDDSALLMDSDGKFSLNSDNNSIESQIQSLWQIWSFGPALIIDGEISVTKNQEISGRSSNSNPRTAIGQIGDLHYIFIVSDGRTRASAGLSLYELASLFRERGCTIAYNLDGGGSSTMYFSGSVVNKPTTRGNRISEREISDIVYIGY